MPMTVARMTRIVVTKNTIGKIDALALTKPIQTSNQIARANNEGTAALCLPRRTTAALGIQCSHPTYNEDGYG